MPLSGPHTYIETVVEFTAHWGFANQEMSPGEVVANGWTRADLIAEGEALDLAMTETSHLEIDLAAARTLRDRAKESVRQRMMQFRSTILSQHPSSPWAEGLPWISRMKNGAGAWIMEMHAFRTIWEEFPGVTLFGGYALADWIAETDDLEAQFKERAAAELRYSNAIRHREQIMIGIERQLRFYVKAVQGSFPSGHPTIESLPRLDALPGKTPDPVELRVEFAEGKFRLDWTASTDKNLRHYKVFSGPLGSKAERVLATVEGTSFETDFGIALGGAAFRVYVVLTTGNEAGSNLVEIKTD